ncbi:uncharacterized protein LOC108142623 isoform X2 [Drosophila elegans]|uniref:uncharacterized protein LOC108142623 isoform X2 n=1 Tax=Drosophila elegans TaxID=30023 RepID=UPI0007E5E8DD|nr:uncharacterized protein LOC108142623 isoform X2 [Drosophila elegans]
MFWAKKCCFCISLQTGCIIIALLGLFLSGMNIDYTLYLLNSTHTRETQYKFPAEVLYTSLQIIPDCLSVLASCLLIFAIISAIYLVTFSIVSSLIGSNLIINESFWHNITYWVYVILWLALTLYFMYIIYSYYRQLKEGEIENAIE